MLSQEYWLAETSLSTHSAFSIGLGVLHPEAAALLCFKSVIYTPSAQDNALFTLILDSILQ